MPPTLLPLLIRAVMVVMSATLQVRERPAAVGRRRGGGRCSPCSPLHHPRPIDVQEGKQGAHAVQVCYRQRGGDLRRGGCERN